jgi:ferrochelatase
VLFPSYQILLLIIGTLVGQFRFFYAFQKKSLAFLNPGKRKKQ